MIKFTKGLFTGHNPKIFSWDNPTHRVFNGEVVKVEKQRAMVRLSLNTQVKNTNLNRGPLNYFMKKVSQKRMLIKLWVET